MELTPQKPFNKIPLFPQPSPWLTTLLDFQAEILHNILTFLFFPIFFLFDLINHRVGSKKPRPDPVVHRTTAVVAVVESGGLFYRKLREGVQGAMHMCIVLVVVLVLAVVLGVCLVRVKVEEPVFVREKLYFDYAEVHPNAVLVLGQSSGTKKRVGVPVGQTMYVSLVLLMPESDYNRDVGMFQLVAEVISYEGNVIDKSSQPCMLRFRSLPIRLVRTSLMSVPLLLGITSETQRLTIPLLKHKEGYPRTEAIRISLVPRAGTSFLPQLYESEILVKSQLPWGKELVHRWKWTFYVWASLYMYFILLIMLICCFRPLLFPVMTESSTSDKCDRDTMVESPGGPEARSKVPGEISETLKRWKESGRKRKAMLEGFEAEVVSSSASSISVTRDDSSTSDEDDRDSECFDN